MMRCSQCGYEVEPDARFCKRCGRASTAFSELANEEAPTAAFNKPVNEEAPTLNLPPNIAPSSDSPRSTEHMNAGQTSSPSLPTSPAYIPPGEQPARPDSGYQQPQHYQQPQNPYNQPQNYQQPYQQPNPYQAPVDYSQPYQSPMLYPQQPGYVPQPVYPTPVPPNRSISLGDWLSGGWRVYKENALLMSLATLLVCIIGFGTLGILAGPMLMGLYRMAFKTMKGERPEMRDLFNWQGRFLQAFLAFLIYAAIYGGISGIGRGAITTILQFVVMPLLTMILGLALPMILESKADIAAAINDIGKKIFTKDALLWWVVGFVFATIASGGFVVCGVGALITVPWIISSLAVAYSNLFALDDPNRTLNE
jgi:hypothetical protein